MPRARVLRLAKRPAAYADYESAPSPSDAELVKQARSGDPAAEQALFKRHAGYILLLSYRLLRDQVEAEDIVQETFLDAITQLRGPAEPVSLRQWLAGICVHKAHRRFRRRKLQAMLGLFRPNDESVLEASAHPDASPEIRAELSLLDLVLARLPDVDRAAWVLRYVEGYTLEDVARLCRCSLATAKRRIMRTRAVVLAHVDLAEVGDV